MNKLLVSLTEIRPRLFIGKLALAAILVLSLIGYVNAQATDTTPPDMVDFSFTPSTIDTTDSAQTVTVTVRATDSDRGVKSIYMSFLSPTGDPPYLIGIGMNSQHLISVSSPHLLYQLNSKRFVIFHL